MRKTKHIKPDFIYGGHRPSEIRCLPSEGLVVIRPLRRGAEPGSGDIRTPRKGDIRFIVRGLLAARHLSAVAAAVQSAGEEAVLRRTILPQLRKNA